MTNTPASLRSDPWPICSTTLAGLLRNHWPISAEYASGIYLSTRALLQGQIAGLVAQYAKSKDATIKAAIDRLTAELAKMPVRWDFYVR